jgi:class 3 adenylate cyclase
MLTKMSMVASRMESTGQPGRIQLSSTTADLLKVANKGHWIVPREDLVVVKGKGYVNDIRIVFSHCDAVK